MRLGDAKGGARDEPAGSRIEVDRLRREVAAIRWFHRIDLGHGIVTPGPDRTRQKLKSLHLPERLDGLSVLDIGTWDGFFAFEAERRGAARVVATDSAVWRQPGMGRAGFDLARQALGSEVEGRDIDLLDLSPATVGTFDLVLFLGVLYHVRDPLGVLERVASVTHDRLVLETHVDLLGCRRPAAAFYPDAELAGDPSNWWGPNEAATAAMLKDVGFRHVEAVFVSPPLSRMARAVKRRTQGVSLRVGLQQGRAVFHARKQPLPAAPDG